MFKRSSANYSLWPEQARPRRRLPLTLAAGGFAIGIVCAVAAVNVASQFIRPMAMEPEPVQNSDISRQIPVYSASSALVAPKESTSEEPSRPRAAAKLALPTIGRAVPVASETDGRGDASAVKMPPVRLTNDSGVPTGPAVDNQNLIRADTKREENPEQTKIAAREPAAPEASVEPPPLAAAPGAEARPAARSRPDRRTERNRSRSNRPSYAREERKPSYGERPSYAPRYRAGPVYGANGAPISGAFPY